jgi:corrinoid protein of di/trimethylamine methyltransferase
MQDILEELSKAVLDCDLEKVKNLTGKAISMNIDPLTIIEKGLADGIKKVGELFERGEVFLPDLMMAAEAMKAGISILEPILKSKKKHRAFLGRVIIGTVEGDIHDIGKNIVATMLEANGFEVIDLGVDVSTEKFISKVKELNPDILAMSALLYTTVPKMGEVIKALEKEGLRSYVKVMVGGAPVTSEIAKKMGADAYGENATSAVREAVRLMKEKERY